jgi:cation diffusion facilitator CzcD-associated flavoprotein CzcO
MEHLDVAVVGAGLSGVAAGRYLQAECPWASYAVFEARQQLGGTWDLFRYPGIRSDSDMFTLGYAFRPWDDSQFIADGDSILRYIEETAATTGVGDHIRFGHRVVRADWRTDEARWLVTAELVGSGETVQFTCGFLFGCTGYYRYDHGYRPEFADLDRFEGTVVDPQHWPEHLDVTGKRVVVIGSGATAITLIPALARTAAHVTMLQRSPTYIAAVPTRNALDDTLRRALPRSLWGPLIRWYHALFTQGFYTVSQRHPGLVKRVLRAGLRRQLPKGYDIATHFTPSYNPWDQRFCIAPDGDLFAAIREGRASVVTDHVDRFVPSGVRLVSGAELEADIVVTATGLELLFFGGAAISVDGEAVDLPSKMTYKGMMLEGVPNFAIAVGYTNASWTLKTELTCAYVCRLLDHMRANGWRQCTPINVDASVEAKPLLGLSSGYVQRSAHLFPRQGSKFPWQAHQSYLRDYRAMKLRRVDDPAMVFSNPAGPDGTPPARRAIPGPADEESLVGGGAGRS